MSEAVDFQPGTFQEIQVRRRTEPVGLSPVDRLLLDRLEEMLGTLELASDPRRSSPISTDARYRPAGSEVDEGVSTRWARGLQRKIRTRLADMLGEAESRLSDTYKPPMPPERVRCLYSRCAHYGKRIPKYVGPNSEIELLHCQGCGKKLGAA